MQSALVRRAASGAVVALAAATLSLGAVGTAHADTTITDLKGTVTGVGGAPAEDIHVEVQDATTGDFINSMHTGPDGTYDFTDLEFDGNVKIWFEDHSTFDWSDSTYYLDRYYGGSRYAANAKPVAISTDGGTVVNFAMTPAAIVSGSVAAADGHELTDGFDLGVLDADMDSPDYEWAANAPDGKSFKIAVEPGSYRFGGFGWDVATVDTPYTTYLSSWWVNSDSAVGATPVNVAAGQSVSGINIRLTNALTARQAPSVSGIAAIGRPLTANPGTWSRNAGTEFGYTWMRGATVVGTGATYVPTVADFGQRLSVVVRALNGEHAGQAASAQTDPVRWPADAKGKAKALAGHKVRFAAKIVSAKQKPVKGKVVVMRGTKVVHKAVKLVKGKAVIVVKHQPKGKQTYTLVYKGNNVVSRAVKPFTVRVH